MAHRVAVERVAGDEVRSMPFVALRSGTGGIIARASDSIDLARLMIEWTQLGRDAAIICTFEHHGAASSWLTAAQPPLPTWAARTCVATADADVINVDVEPDAAPVFALLSQAGGQLVANTNSSRVPQLVNTVKALNGEVAVVRMLLSVDEAESWLLSPSLPAWLLAPVPAAPAAKTLGRGVELGTAAADGVIDLSDDEGLVGDKAAATESAFRRAAQALPPRPSVKRTILSMGSLQDSMLLPVAFQRHPVTGMVVRGISAGRASGNSCSSSATGASLLTPPSPLPSTPSVASRTPARCQFSGTAQSSRRTGRDGATRNAGRLLGTTAAARSSTAMGTPAPMRSGASAATRSLSFSSGRRATPRGGQSSGSASLLVAGSGNGSPMAPRPPPQTCTPVHSSVSPSNGRPAKKLRLAEALPFDMGRLARSILRRKRGLFVTGGGGVGKTRLLRQCADEHSLAEGGSHVGLHVVAPTGVAAAVAGGVTLHAYLRQPAGCFNESLTEGEDAARIYRAMDASTKRRLADTSLLLVDEVSMVSSRMFTLLAYAVEMAHTSFNKDGVWRMVAFGDFFQLPPVRGDEDNFDTSGMYAFKSLHWARLFSGEQLQLRYVWRQEDKKFVDMLSRLRVGDVSNDLVDFLETRSKVYHSRLAAGGLTDLDVTHIFPHRHRVNAHNHVCLTTMELVNGCAREVFMASDYPIGVNMTKEQVTTQLDAALMAPEKLELCVGARVAACATVVDGDVEVPNGTVGTVVRLKVIGAHVSSAKATKVPIVRFDTVRGPVTVVVKHVDMKLQSVARDGAYASRYQIPLVLAWAVTVHRCQGLSMDAAVMDLAPCFVDGMVYVALSRVRSMEGVHILSYSRGRVQADQRVASFYDSQRDLDDEFLDCVDISWS